MVIRGLPSGTCWDDETDTQRPLPGAPTVGVSDQGVLNQPVNLFCVLPIRMAMQRDTRFILVQAIEALRPV